MTASADGTIARDAAADDALSPGITRRSFIQELPPELLCYIFTFIEEYSDLITSTHVCKHWRKLSVAYPGTIWADVRSSKAVSGVLAQVLARTQDAPARVSVLVRTSNAVEVADALSAHISHIQRLSIQIDQELELQLAKRLAEALSLRAPILQHLVIMDIYRAIPMGFDALESPSRMHALLGGEAPRLTCAKLYCIPSHYVSLPAFSNVRHVMYAPVGNHLRPRELNAVLRFGPFDTLEMLALEIKLWAALPAFRERLPPSLKALSVAMEEACFNAAEFLHALDGHRDVPHVRIAYTSGCNRDVAAALLDYFLPSAGHVVDLTIDSSTSDLALFEATTAKGKVRELYDVPAILPENAFSHLTRLSISEWEWTGIDPFPSAPVLTHLMVRLVAPLFMDLSTHRSVFLSGEGGVLCAPRLHTLGISTRQRGDPALLGLRPALAPGMIAEFICEKIVFDGEKVPVLFLNGVRLIENIVDEVIELLDLVEEVTCGPGHVHSRTELEDVIVWE